jgi:hypothetical protein
MNDSAYNRDSMHSLRAAARAVSSPRVLGVIAALSGWAFAAATYVAGTARQTDLKALEQQVRELVVTAEAAEKHATEAGQRALSMQESAALSYRALVGLCARAKGGNNAAARRNAEADAELRYSRALTDGLPPAAAIRSALE